MRYVNSLNLTESTECFILIEPGLGYMIPVIQERFKHSKIIALHVDNFKSQEEVYKFLENETPDAGIDRICIVEWRPSLDFYKERYVKLLSAAVEFLKRKDAETRTTAVFGKRWVKNFFKNLSNINSYILYRQSDIPVIITGSGPSLEQALPVIRKMQDNCLIIAASSSVLALTSAGIKADIVIASDGGSWALKHIYPFYRADNPALAVNLCAALPSQCADTPQLIINDGSYWQSIALNELSLPSVIIPQKGTVTAVSVELAMLLSTGKLYTAGMDFSVNDIRSHARPYAFDYLFFENANRFTPAYSKCFTRSSLIKQGGSMDIYAAWFRNQKSSWPCRIYSLTGGHKVFDEADLPELLQGKQNKKKTKDFFNTVGVSGDPRIFRKKALAALSSAMKDQKYAQNIKQELGSLLFPGEKNITAQKIEHTLAGIING